MMLCCLMFCITNLCLLVAYIHYDTKDKERRKDAFDAFRDEMFNLNKLR